MANTKIDLDLPTPSAPFLERRTYIAAPGKFEAILRRFQDHTLRFFAKHDIAVVSFGYDTEGTGQLEYAIAWRDGEHRRAGWASFLADEEWIAIRTESQLDGLLVDDVHIRLLLIPEWAMHREGCALNAPVERLSA